MILLYYTRRQKVRANQFKNCQRLKVLDNIKDRIPRKANKIRRKSKLDKTKVEKLKKSNRIGK